MSGAKKRRAPLPPEEVYPNLGRGTLTNVQNASRTEYKRISTERKRKTLPLYEPDLSSPWSPYSSTGDTGISKSSLKGPNDINFPSDNEALDVHESSEDVKAFINASRNGKKRHSSGDLPKLLRCFNTSQSSLQSLNSSHRSFSLNSLSSAFSTEYAESQMVDQEDIITLTVHVRHFSVALSKLRNAFSESGSDTDSDELTDNGNVDKDMHVKAHEHLGKVLSNLKEVINEYPALQSNEILAAAGHLISQIKSHNYEENRIPDEFYQSIDQLALVFSSSISDFLMGDQEPSPKGQLAYMSYIRATESQTVL